MKQNIKKLVSLVLVFAISMTVSISAYAAENSNEKVTNTSAYQAVIDKINEEYGVNFHFPTQAELKKANISNSSKADSLSSVSAEQFEKQLSEIAEHLAKQNAEARAAWEAASNKGGAVDSATVTDKLTTSVTYVSSQYQDLEGGKAYLEGYVNNSTGFWKWTKFTTTKVTPDYSSTTSKFYLYDSSSKKVPYSYTFIDANRTCAVTYNGTMYNNTVLGWVASDSTQYTEWSASDGH